VNPPGVPPKDEWESPRALTRSERSQPRAVRPAAKAKASRPAVTGLLAQDKVSLPVASPVPAEIKRPLTLPGNISSLSLKTP